MKMLLAICKRENKILWYDYFSWLSCEMLDCCITSLLDNSAFLLAIIETNIYSTEE